MNARNLRNGSELSHNVALADSLLKRMKGLLGKSSIQAGESLWIRPCTCIHTFFMKFPIDVIFLDKNNRVIAANKNLQPNRATKLYLKSASVLELPVGILEATDTRVGDEIEIA